MVGIDVMASGLDNFSSDDDSDNDNVRDDPSNQPILWGLEEDSLP